MTGPKAGQPSFIDMPFGEALRRFAQTKPEEVSPPPGRKAKAPRVTELPVDHPDRSRK